MSEEIEQPRTASPSSTDQSSHVKETALPGDEPPAEVDPYPTLKPRHQRFIDHLLRSGNQTQAWIAAGYTDDRDAAKVNASRLLLTNADVRRSYGMRIAQLSARANVSRERWLAEVADMALLQPEDAKRWIDVGVKIGYRDKLGGAQLLGKALGWLEEKSGDNQRQLIIDLSVQTTVQMNTLSSSEELTIDLQSEE